jgi:N-ethylmaleimide reductase
MSMLSQSPTSPTLFSPAHFGDLVLANRVVMAPLTRNRAGAGLVPSRFAAEYYSQRAGAGLIITEATQVSREAQGYLDTPGLYTREQVAAWRKVTDAVHAKGGRIVAQLWHVGRIAHTSLLPEGVQPVAPSALRANAKTFTRDGFVDVSPPRALALDEIPAVIDSFRSAARHAIEAGFDGVEVHGANGYLIDQFLRNGANRREDAYGGSIENRTRFLVEVVGAVADEIGAGRVGVRLSPVTPAGDLSDSDPQPLFERAVERLDALGIAYIHIIEGATGGARDIAPFDFAALRTRFSGAWIVNNGYDRAMALDAVQDGRADAVAFGVPFLANPDLPARLREDAPLNKPDQATFYGGGAKGYTDYPTLEETAAA